MRDHLSGIEVFVAVVEAGSFAQAAQKQHVTRSAIGKSIARLEQRLGVLLFHRTTRSQSLTDDGQLYYRHCLQGLEAIRAGEALLEGGKDHVSGRLRVSMPTLFGQLYVAPILIELAKAHPALTLELSFTDRRVDLIEEAFDLAIRIGALPDSSSLVARPLGEHHMVFCASPDYLRRRGKPESLEALNAHDAVSYLRFDRGPHWPPRTDIQPKTRLLMDDMRAVADAALAHMGIAWLPYWLVREALLRGQLQEVLQEHSGEMFAIHAVWPYTPHRALKIRVAVDALLAQLPPRMAVIQSPSG